MTKVLWLSDFNAATGFATVAENIMTELMKTGEYKFTVIGINHFGEPYDYNRWPFPIYPAINMAKMDQPEYKDYFGRQRLLDFLGTGEFDIVFTLQDHFILQPIAKQIIATRDELIKLGKKPFKWILYYPVDGQMRKEWSETVGLADIPITYTEFGKQETARFGVVPRVIPHGTNLIDFYPLENRKELKQKYFKTDKFIVMNVNRNQPRKAIPQTLQAFKKFQEIKDSLLYLHMLPNDVGGDIIQMARELNLSGDSLMMPETMYPVNILNEIYNAVDVVISTTFGEGWGLSCTEAMATKTPVIMPDNTSLSEICADGRGLLVKSGNVKVNLLNDNGQFRPLTDIDSMVNSLVETYDNPDEAKKRADKAYEWVVKLSWENVCKNWLGVFEQASVPMVIKSRNGLCVECLKKGISKKNKRCKEHNGTDYVEQMQDMQENA